MYMSANGRASLELEREGKIPTMLYNRLRPAVVVFSSREVTIVFNPLPDIIIKSLWLLKIN